MAKQKAAKPGVGSDLANAKSINTEKPPRNKVGCGTPNTYFGNSRSIDTEHSRKGKK